MVPVRGAAAAHPARTAAWLAKQVERVLADADLTLPQYRVLGLLGEGSALASRLAARLDVRPPTVTAVVDGLVARGLVQRVVSGDDRRKVTHSLTAAGSALLAEADAACDGRLAEIAGGLDRSEAEAAFAGLELWRQALLARVELQHSASP